MLSKFAKNIGDQKHRGINQGSQRRSVASYLKENEEVMIPHGVSECVS